MNNTFSDNNIIKVGIIIHNPYIELTKIKDSNGKKKIVYSGAAYELWNIIKKMNNWENRVQEFPLKMDYKKNIDNVENGKYDILVGNILNFEALNLEKVLVSRTLYLNKIVVVFKPNESKYQLLLRVALELFLLPLIIIVILGFVFGIGLYFFETKRGIKRSIKTTTASFFGEMGFLFENASTKTKPLIYIYIVAALAYYFNIALQALVTSDIIDKKEENEFDIVNLEKLKTPLLVFGHLGEIVEKYGAKYKKVFFSAHKLPSYYLKNLNKFSGYIATDYKANHDLKRFPELKITEQALGYKETVFVVSKRTPELLQDINESIDKIHFSNMSRKICEKYIGDEKAQLCVL